MESNRYSHIYGLLHEKYGYRNWWPIITDGKSLYSEEFRTRRRSAVEMLEIAVGALLTQNTAWSNVEKALFRLKSEIPMDITAFLNTDKDTLAELIRPAGYFNQKARKIQELSHFITNECDAKIENLSHLPPASARKKLLSVWGIGPETADSILLYGFYHPVFVVDAYTRRIFSRLGCFDKGLPYEDIRAVFENNLSGKGHYFYNEYHALIVKHAVEHCKTKPVCEGCVLREECRFKKEAI